MGSHSSEPKDVFISGGTILQATAYTITRESCTEEAPFDKALTLPSSLCMLLSHLPAD